MIDAPAADAPAVVEIRRLWTAFPSSNGGGEQVVHRDLDLTIRRGEVLSLVGGSGTGKTVLLRQILGLEHPTRGEVTVLGQRPGQLGARDAAKVGMLFQHGALFSAFSVLENIALPLRELKLLPDALIRDAALVKLQLVGLDPAQAHKSPSALSGGMIKRVALARALALEPELLFLDEPTAGLDPASSAAFIELIRSLHKDMSLTVVMITHDLEPLLALSTKIAVLADKHVIAYDTPERVMKVRHPFIETFFLTANRYEHETCG